MFVDYLIRCIPLYVIKSIRTAPKYGGSAFEIDAFSKKFYFRSPSEDVTHQWLFCFQCTIATQLEEMITEEFKGNKISDIQLKISFSNYSAARKQRILRIDKWWKKSKLIEKQPFS